MNLVLASKSPRRKELLTLAGYEFEINVSDVDESVEQTNPVEKVAAIAKKKGLSIFTKYNDDNVVVLSADTIVVINDEVLGKPKDKEEARKMITKLQNNIHYVYTAVYIKSIQSEDLFVEKTEVKVTEMNNDEIEEYINTNEPYDKAGGYGIQGIFSKYISSINGDYYNVMGLPIYKVRQTLKQYDFTKKQKCSICNYEINSKMNYCSNCGHKIKKENETIICNNCKKSNSLDNKYCINCGKVLTSKEETQTSIVQIKKDTSGVSLACGIISFVTAVYVLTAILSVAPGIISIITGIKNIKKGYKTKSIIGIVFGSIGLLISLLYILFFLLMYLVLQ